MQKIWYIAHVECMHRKKVLPLLVPLSDTGHGLNGLQFHPPEHPPKMQIYWPLWYRPHCVLPRGVCSLLSRSPHHLSLTIHLIFFLWVTQCFLYTWAPPQNGLLTYASLLTLLCHAFFGKAVVFLTPWLSSPLWWIRVEGDYAPSLRWTSV